MTGTAKVTMSDDDAAQPKQDATFEPDERPTHPSAPGPEELAMQTWLAAESRAIGPRRSATSRFRAVAIAAVEGGAARVSHVDMLEANARARVEHVSEVTEPLIEPVIEREEPRPPAEDVELGESGTRPVAVTAEDDAATDAPPPGAEASLPSRLGPRGTVRIEARVERGPTGTLKLQAPLAAAAAAAGGEPRPPLRIQSMVVVCILAFCGLDVAWLAVHPVPDSSPARAPIQTVLSASPPTDPPVSEPAAPQPASTAPLDTAPATSSSASPATLPAELPATPTPKHRAKHRRATAPSTVF